MRCLTLTQPFATLVAIQAKRLETRSWRTPYRGTLLIHAAKTWSADDRSLCFEEPFFELLAGEYRRFEPQLLPLGAIIATAILRECVPTEELRPRLHEQWVSIRGQIVQLPPYERAFGNYDMGRFAWWLDDVRALPEPIPCRGSLGVWVPPQDALERVRELLAVAL